jgi:membrane dipeptidase
MVGVNFAVSFLREDGSNEPATPLAEIVRHVGYLVDRMGIDHVALGSDFDGAVVPAAVGGVSGLPRVVAALSQRYDEHAVAKITHRNWLRVLDATW